MKRPPFTLALIVAAALAATGRATASAAGDFPLISQDGELPWNDLVMVVILMLAFFGGTLAIINTARRR